jgi:hypothetical protein
MAACTAVPPRAFSHKAAYHGVIRMRRRDALEFPFARLMLTGNFRGVAMPGKRVQFDDETWLALDLLARDRMADFQELADEAFADLLRKYDRPTDLKTALRRSAGEAGGRRSAGKPQRPRREPRER